MDTRELRTQHADILDQVGVIRALMQMPVNSTVVVNISERLDVLAATLSLHLSQEDRDFYPAFLLSEDEKIRTCAERFFVEMGHLRRAFGNFKDAWRSASSIQSNFVEFASNAHRVFSLLENRIERENNVLFPLWENSPGTLHSIGEEVPIPLRKQA
ncbi:MAG: hemerythrin domain-containing protein [Elusimicrobia bacterium]|nr:hemerythrin domain-containing protein [Elusimicrobiota bacterium]